MGVVAPYSFQGHGDGQNPTTVIVAPNGSLIGTSVWGGAEGCACGTIFKLTPSPPPPRTALTPWHEVLLHQFSDFTDGSNPTGSLVFDHADNLYGTTNNGGSTNGGTVYELTQSGGSWTLTDIHVFAPISDGFNPEGGVVMDASGNLYGTTEYGGSNDDGTVFELSPSENGWTEHILYSFQNESDGGHPGTSLTLDQAGNLYGTAGPVLFELTPSTGGNWSFNVIYNLGTQSRSATGMTLDNAGNLYGTTFTGGSHGAGSVFELMRSGDRWTYVDLYDYTGPDGRQPDGNLLIDEDGNLFGTTLYGGTNDLGEVFEFVP